MWYGQPAEHIRSTLQDLWRAERNAVTLCEGALERVPDPGRRSQLQRIFAAHRQAVDLLRVHLCRHRIPLPDQPTLGLRERRALERVESAAQAFALVRGMEQRVISRYRHALAAPTLMPDCRVTIEQSLLPDRLRDARSLRMGPARVE